MIRRREEKKTFQAVVHPLCDTDFRDEENA